MIRFVVLPLLLLVGCQSPGPEPARYARADPVDMTGNWEVDYSRSDNIQRQFNTIIRQLQQEAERREPLSAARVIRDQRCPRDVTYWRLPRWRKLSRPRNCWRSFRQITP